MSRAALCLLLAAAVPLPAVASGDEDATGPAPPPVEQPAPPPPPGAPVVPSLPTSEIRAVQVAAGPRVDGRLDDAAWQAAPVFDAFVLNEPIEGGTPSERTELRIVYDDRNIYIAFRCFDSHPAEILRTLGRRDSEPSSDFVVIFLSPSGDGRTARRFVLNAGGVQADSLHYDDVNSTQSWDAVWRGDVAVDASGWSAEYAIPLYLVGAFDGPRPSWGFLARRYIARTHEKPSSTLIPRSSNGFVSLMGTVGGVEKIAPRRALELLPYLAIRSMARPDADDPAAPREALAAGDIGVDASLGLPRGMLLNVTLNPDFGQVEADDIILNLTTFESFFPEKRPFFTQGLDLFQPVGDFTQLQNLFYSRRIGRQAPILGAAKLTGSPLSGLSVGLLDAVVTGDRLLHLETDDEDPGRAGVASNYLAAVARAAVAGAGWVGARFSSATPLDGRCSDEDLTMTPAPARCRISGGNAAALDANLKTAGGDWGAIGQVAVSQVVGGPPSRRLLDGTDLERGDLGLGGYLRAGKMGGGPLQLQLGYEHESRRLDLNAVGFQRNQNRHFFLTNLGYVRPNGFGPLPALYANLEGTLGTSADGRWLNRERKLALSINATLPGFHSLDLNAGLIGKSFDLRELRGSGVALETPGMEYTSVNLSSDPSRILSGWANVALGRHDGAGAHPTRFGYTVGAGFTLRPTPAFETRLDATLDFTPNAPRFVSAQGGDGFLLASMDNLVLSSTLRQQWAMTRDLTLQAYAQLFSAYAVYGPFYEGHGTPSDPVRLDGLVATAAPMTSPDVHTTELVINVILRWEYRPGATIYLVYSRDQQEKPPERVEGTLASKDLFGGPAVDVVSLKWTWFWSG